MRKTPRHDNHTAYLSDSDASREDNRSQPNSKYFVNEKATKEAENDVWPGIPSVQGHVRRGGDTHVFLDDILKSPWIVIAEVTS